MPLVFLQVVGQQVLIAQSHVVNPLEASEPVAVLQFAMSLDVVLSACKVPHEVAPVHEVALIRQEETYVFHLCGHLHINHFATSVVLHGASVNASHPTLVGIGMAGVVHAGEEHVLCVLIVALVAHDEVRVFLCVGGFLLALIFGSALAEDGAAHVAINAELHLRGVGLSVEQRTVSILVAAEVFAQSEDVFGRVLVHGRVGRRTDDDDGIRGVANHEHEQAEQCGVLHAGRDGGHTGYFAADYHPQQGQHHNADEECRPAIAVERDAEHAHRCQKRDVLARAALVLVCFVDGPNDDAHQQQQVDDDARVEGHAQRVDEEQLEPSAHGDDARHHAIEYGGDEHKGNEQGYERSFQVGIGKTLVVINQHNGGYTEKVEQVDADGKPRHIHDEHQPAVAVRLVGVVLPLQDEPKHHCREGR